MRALRLSAALLSMLTANAALAGDAATPEKVTTCAACHGADGKAVLPMYPNLAGQYANYLEHALKEYRAGGRKNPIMGAQAATLSDAEIKQLAAYYSAQPSHVYTPGIHGVHPK